MKKFFPCLLLFAAVAMSASGHVFAGPPGGAPGHGRHGHESFRGHDNPGKHPGSNMHTGENRNSGSGRPGNSGGLFGGRNQHDPGHSNMQKTNGHDEGRSYGKSMTQEERRSMRQQIRETGQQHYRR